MFRFEKVEDFEEHINLSIPNYRGLCDIFRAFAAENTHRGGTLLDIGCSSGAFLESLEKVEWVRYVGCDIVDIRAKHCRDAFEFYKRDAGDFLEAFDTNDQVTVDVIISMFTLQFLGRHKRVEVIRQMKSMVDRGAVLLVAEKVFMPSKVESVLKREHIQQKRKHFTEAQILDKERDLFGSMHCVTDTEFAEELSFIGNPVQVWQSYNFKGYIVSPRH